MEDRKGNIFPVVWLMGFVLMCSFLLIDIFFPNPINYLMIMGGFMIMTFGACIPFAHNFIEEEELYE